MDLGTLTSHRTPTERGGLALADGETFVAGGTWLFSEPQPHLSGLVDLTTLGWPDLETLPDGGLRVAATCPVAVLRDLGPTVLRDAADALLMSWKVQAVATVGGNVCLALPAGAMTSVTAGLGGTAVIWTPDGGERREPVAELVRGVRATSLRPGEVLRAIDLPSGWDADGPLLRRMSLTRSGRSAAVVVGRPTPEGPVLTVTGSTTRPVVLTHPAQVAAIDCWHDDVHGAPDWRAAMTARLLAEVHSALGGER